MKTRASILILALCVCAFNAQSQKFKVNSYVKPVALTPVSTSVGQSSAPIVVSPSKPTTPKQTSWCRTDEITQTYIQDQMKTDPMYAKKYAAMQQSIFQIINNGTYAKKPALYTIPVVVHVVHNPSNSNNPTENVPDAIILDMINTLNEDFQRLNPDTVNTRSVFLPDAADAQIAFCLASKDPLGASTTGITRTVTSEVYYNNNTETNKMKSASTGGADPWDPYKYLNIWVCNISNYAGFGVAGYAYLPTPGMHGSSIDGLVLDFDIGIGYGDRTGTHEIGHYLGLGHTWGNNPPSCSNDDGFADTPNAGTEQYGCNYSTNSCGTPNGDQIENYMSYANCQNMYSNDQAAYMNAILTGMRVSLLTSTGCEPTAPPVADFSVSNTTIIVGSNAQFTDLSTGIPDQWSWTFGGGGTPNTSTVKNPNILFNTIGTYDVYLTATNSLGSDDTLKTAYIDVIALPPCGIPGAFYCEDFESVTAPALPVGISTATLGSDGGFYTGDDADADAGGFWPVPAHTQFVMTNDDVCNCNKSQDYLQLPTFDFSGQPPMGIQMAVYDDGLYGQNPSTLEMNVNNAGWNVIHTFDQIASWQTIRRPLTGSAGFADVKIRFAYDDAGSWATGLAIDDIVIYDLPDNDLYISPAVGQTRKMDPWLTPIFNYIPIRQTGIIDFSGRVANVGASNQPNTILTVEMTKGLNTRFNNTSVPLTLNSGIDSLLTVTPSLSLNPVDTGFWDVTFTASSDSVDAFAADNVVNTFLNITDTVFGRDNNFPWYQFNAATFGLTSAYRFANFFEFAVADTINSITVLLGPGTVVGTTIRGQIYDDALNPAPLEQTSFYTVTAADTMPNFLTLKLQNPLPVTALSNVFAAFEEFAGDDTSMRVVHTWQKTPAEVPGYIYGTGTWYYISYTPFIRINMASTALGCLDSLDMSTVDASCGGACDGQASAVVNGGTAPYTYFWDDPASQTNATAVGLCQGSYTVRVLDTYGCELISGISVTDGASMSLTMSTVDESCGNSDGTATVTATGGTGAYTYTWSDAQTTSTAVGLAAGTYNVTIEDNIGCSVETDFFSAANIGNIPPPTANADVDVTICASDTYTTNGAIGSSATSSTWSSSGTGTFDNTALLIAVYTPSNVDTAAGSVTLTLTTNDPDGAGPCVAVADVMTLTIAPVATVNAGADDAVCEGDTYTLAGTRGGAASISTWTSSGTGTFSNATLLNAVYTPSAADITAGTVTLTITTNDPAGPCPPVVDNMTLTINPMATASAGADATICEGTTHTLAGSRGGSATSSNWSTSGSGGFNNTSLLTATYTPSAADITAGTVNLTITTDDPDGVGPCLAATDVMVLTINAAATASAGADDVICEGSTYTLGGAIGGGASSSNWSTSGTGTFNNSTLLAAIYTPSAGDITVGNVTLTLSTDDPPGPCGVDSDPMVLTIDPAATASAGVDATICSNGTHTVSGTRGGSASSSTWTTSGTGTFANASLVTTVYTPSAADISAGTVNLTITTDDPAGQCTAASDVLTLTIDTEATINAGGDATICEGSAYTLAGSIGGGASSSTWTTSGTGTFDNATIVNATYTPSAADISAGSITLTITSDDPPGPCLSATDNMILTINLDPTSSAGADVTICEGNSNTLSGSIGGGASNSSWSTGGTGTFDNASLLAATYTPSATDITAGTVTLTLTTDDPPGPCVAATDNMTITINGAATASAGADATICEGVDHTLAGSIGGSAGSSTWSTSGTGTFDNTTLLNAIYTPSAADVSAGSVTLTITTNDPSGPCGPDFDAMTLTLNAKDDPAFAYSSGTFCQTGIDPTPTISGTPGGLFSEASANVVFISTSTGEIDLGASTLGGPYSVEYVTNGTCPDSSTVSVTITTSPDASFSYVGPYCQDDVNPLPTFTTGSAGIFSATPGGMVFVNASTGEIDLAGSTAGTYTVKNLIVSSGGCAGDSSTFSVTVDLMATASAGVDATICEGDSYTLSGTRGGSAASSNWTSSGTGTFDDATIVGATYTPSALDISGGNVTLTISTDDPGGPCDAATDDMILIINPSATTTAGSNDTICEGDVKVLSGSIGGSASTATWTSSGTGTFDDATLLGATYTPSAADAIAGTVTLTISTDDPTGPCNAATDNLVLVINQAPTVIAGADATVCEGSGHTLSGTMGGGASSITWTTSGTGAFDDATLPGATYTPSALDVTVGTVTLIITTDDPAGSCIAATDNLLLTINTAATAAAGADTSICDGDTYTLAGSMGGSSSSIVWTTSGTGSFDDATLGAATYTPSAADISGGIVTLTVTSDDPDGAGPCSAAADDMVLTIDANATASAGSDASVCEGLSYTLSGTFGGGASSINWTTSGNGSFDDATLPGATYTPSAADILAGSLTLTITTDDPAGSCLAVTDDMVLTISPMPTITSEIATDISCNGANDGVIDIVAAGGSGVYNYSIDAGSTFQAGSSFTGLGAGTYDVVVTDSAGCSVTGSTLTIAEPAAIVVTTNSVDANCGGSNGEVSAVASGGTGTLQYLWDDPSAATTDTVINLPANTYMVVVTDFNGCTASSSTTVANIGGGIVTASLVKDAECNGGCDGEATSTMSGGTAPFVYSWNDPGSQTGVSATGLCAGDVIVTVTDANSCQTSDTVTISEPSAMVITLTPNDALLGTCDGLATVSVTGGTGAYSYLWDDGQTGTAAINLCPGPIGVTVTDGNGCVSTMSTTIGTYIGTSPIVTDLINFSIYPNPTQGNLYIEYSFTEAIDFDLSVFNKLGAVVVNDHIEMEKSGTHVVEFTDQANGIYYVQLITNQGTIIKKVSLIR